MDHTHQTTDVASVCKSAFVQTGTPTKFEAAKCDFCSQDTQVFTDLHKYVMFDYSAPVVLLHKPAKKLINIMQVVVGDKSENLFLALI